ncbi:hypothetical protein [Microbacterium sp. LWH11-1.2]|uniref:hypothetical protein n=1 Tax=Microbacterium sp. LWH11-1.2 TaxID=3135258 RepID=UPI0031396E1A
MDGLTLTASAAASVGASSRTGAVRHLAAGAGMLALMAPALLLGHASLAGIGVTLAFFAWATVAAVHARRRNRVGPCGGAVGDPFAMGLMMAVPYLALGFGGHAHGTGADVGSTGTVAVAVIGLFIVAGWTALRAGAARADRAGRFGFWSCLLMMLGMLAAMSIPS